MKKSPLQFAQDITAQVIADWESGAFMEKVNPTTRDLLTYWFERGHTENRELNFHEGQKQSILNVIYIHEVLKSPTIFEVYQHFAPDLLVEKEVGIGELGKAKYAHPKYCIKMATGTGKTWVLSALLIWQYLNAKHEKGNYSKNFLIVAPGLIVYERLLDAFIGKEREDGDGRDFETSDIFRMQELFLPQAYKEEVFGFFKSSVVRKDEIGRKVTGDGMIAVTNWHLLAGVEDDEDEATENPSKVDPQAVVKSLLPARPGASAGNDLNVLDNAYGQGQELEFLKSLPDLVVFNDEAHHIHEVKRGQDSTEVEWQKSLTAIAEPKGIRFVQVDFSATPYNQVGKEKVYFPHIIVDFDLKTAIHKGLIKTLVLDRRKEIAAMELDFRAERDEDGNIIGLSEGQRVMLRAGLQKLTILAKHFGEIAPEKNKYPKMLVVCEENEVAGYVVEFLRAEGLSEEEVLEVHSTKKGELKQEEWEVVRNRLFHLDTHPSPKVVVSVLMLREGFDVNNICVIVPLRSTQSDILLEQTIGRGLRQMWREPEFREEKEENRKRMFIEKREPKNYFDILSIIEHPAFVSFYEELIKDGLIGADERELTEDDEGPVTGDIISVGLRDGYEKYDFTFPIIVQEAEEVIRDRRLTINDLKPLEWPTLDQLKRMVQTGEVFVAHEITKGTRFGDYSVHGGIMTATSYNEYVSRLVNRVSVLLSEPIATRHTQAKVKYPAMQIKMPQLAELTDTYIKQRLFSQEFNPFENENWRVLLVSHVAEHIIKELASAIEKLQETEAVSEPQVLGRKISDVTPLRMREPFSIPTARTIYERTPYPSQKGGFEKALIEYADADSTVEAFVKLLPYAHTFVRFRYMKADGLGAYYHPDFLIRCNNGHIYLVETKAEDQLSHPNVERKHISAVNWTERINKLPPEMRSNAEWQYVLLGESFFYDWRSKGASVAELLEFAKLRPRPQTGRLFE